MQEEDLILLAQEQARQQKPLISSLTKIGNKIDKQYVRTNRSQRITIDLSRAHIDTPLHIEYPDRIYLWLTIERADNPFTYKLGQTGETKSEQFTGTVGADLEQHEFTEIYVTNTTALGEADILVGWRE